MADNGLLERLTHGVYRVAGADDDQFTNVYADWLALDPERTATERITDRKRFIAVSHRSAAEIYSIGDLPALDHTFTASYRKQTQRTGVRVHTGDIDRSDVRIEQGMLVTTPERTIADLYRTEGDQSHVADVLADAIIDRRLTRSSMIAAMPGKDERARAAAVDALLAQRGLDAESLADSVRTKALTTDIAQSFFASYERTIRPLQDAIEALGPIDLPREALGQIGRAFEAIEADIAVPRALLESMGEFASAQLTRTPGLDAAIKTLNEAVASQSIANIPWQQLENAAAVARQIEASTDAR
jgi:hypothetical protein